MGRFHKLGVTFAGQLILLSVSMGGYEAISGGPALADDPPAAGTAVPTGKTITPTAAARAIFQNLNPGHAAAPDVRADQAAAVAVSPDGKLLAILTSGFNIFFGADGKTSPELSTEYVFLFDITEPQPRQLQVLPVPNTFQGLAWAPSSERFFVSGGGDDAVLEFVRNGSTFAAARTFPLGHKTCFGLEVSDPGWKCKPEAGGLAVSPDGTRLLVTNLQNDSVSLIDLAGGQVVAEQDLRPGLIDPKRRGQPGGSYPRCVVWISADRAFVGSERDREIISLAISPAKIRRSKISVVRRMPVQGQPAALIANRNGSRIYAALDNSDQAVIFDTTHDALIEALDVTAPPSVYANAKKLSGANTNALTLTPDERTLLVSDGGENAVAVIHLSDRARGLVAAHRQDQSRVDRDDDRQPDSDHSEVMALVPTGWYPTGVATSKDGARWYVINGKSETGPSAAWCTKVDPQERCVVDNRARNWGPFPLQYAPNGFEVLVAVNQQNMQLEKAGFLTIPVPSAQELARLTKQVAHNDHFDQPDKTTADERLFSFLREHIKHVIYIIKENRTYDQILGDLEIGNGDPRLTLFPERLSPNHHAIARNFVTFDNFLVSGEGSWTGWDWAVAANTNDLKERSDIPGLAGRVSPIRNINTGYATSAERKANNPLSPSDPNILPGTRDPFELDGPGGEEGKGYLWDAALRRGLTLRNWGFFGDFRSPDLPLIRDPYAQKQRVFFPSKASLTAYSDPYYREFELALPDYWKVQEWKREFAEFSASKTAPNLMLVQLGNDHFGDFARAIDGVNTPDTQMADNDYSLGIIIEAVAKSPFANNTLIVSVEDDTWDGPDHADAFRTLALFAGPYLQQHALVSTRYTTVSLVKTIEEILGIGPIGLNDALAAPMSDVFDTNAASWTYKAIVPDVLYSTKLPLPPPDHAVYAEPSHSAAYWAKAMAGQDFSGPDRVNPVTFNRALWRGLKGDAPYPATAARADFRADHEPIRGKTQRIGSSKEIPAK